MFRKFVLHTGGYVAVAVILTAGAAQSLAGTNTVTTDDIVDNNVTNADFGTNSVTSNKVAPNTLTGSDINERALNMAGNCSSGMLQGTVLIQGGFQAADIPDTYGTFGRVFEYNCTGGAVLVRRHGVGDYFVKFVGSGHRGATATIDDVVNPNGGRYAQVADRGPGEIEVLTYNAAGAIVDADVEVLFW